MKKTLIFGGVLIFLLIAGCRNAFLKDMIVTRDCTGTYLQIDGSDYLVCNDDKLESYAEGESVTATYKEVDECQNGAVCYMLHLHEGIIEVIRIK